MQRSAIKRVDNSRTQVAKAAYMTKERFTLCFRNDRPKFSTRSMLHPRISQSQNKLSENNV